MSKWTQEQLQQAFEFEASVGDPQYGAKIHLIPMFRGGKGEGYGSEIDWDCRLLCRGRFGPAPVDTPNLMAVGVSEEEAETIIGQVEYAKKQLRRAYPELRMGIETKVKALEKELKVALPAGE